SVNEYLSNSISDLVLMNELHVNEFRFRFITEKLIQVLSVQNTPYALRVSYCVISIYVYVLLHCRRHSSAMTLLQDTTVTSQAISKHPLTGRIALASLAPLCSYVVC